MQVSTITTEQGKLRWPGRHKKPAEENNRATDEGEGKVHF
jgi:hypothetical protein